MRDLNCLFCKIGAGEIPAKVAYQDEVLMALYNIKPEAPVHLVIFPKDHIMKSVADMQVADQAVLGQMLWRAKQLAEQEGVAANGYRLVFNNRQHSGQEVDHVHLHLLGGQPLKPLG